MSQIITVKLLYFAVFEELRGKGNETIHCLPQTARELYDELRVTHKFPYQAGEIQVAINDDFASWDDELKDQDQVVFIAPVSGG